MNARFLIPATVALAIHGGLFFGFPTSEREAKPKIEMPSPPPFNYVPLDLIEPEPLEVICGGPPSINPPPAPRPTSADLLIVDVGDRIPIDLPKVEPAVVGDIREIVPVEFRSGEGLLGSKWRDGIIPGGALDSPPRTRYQAAPAYPFEKRKEGVPGEVWVEFDVDETGVVHNPRVTKSSDRAFEEPTIRAVAKWRFEPGKRHGQVVAFRMTVPVIFSLNE